MKYLLPCESCSQPITVATAQAGDDVRCPECDSSTPVPKLGVLKALPAAESESQPETGRTRGVGGGSFVFAAMAMVAVVCFGVAVFCGIRWGMVTVPQTTEGNIADLRQQYSELPPANLIREWEDMEKYGLDIVGTFKYHTLQKQKDDWGNATLVAIAIGVGSLIIGFVASLWRPQKMV